MERYDRDRTGREWVRQKFISALKMERMGFPNTARTIMNEMEISIVENPMLMDYYEKLKAESVVNER